MSVFHLDPIAAPAVIAPPVPPAIEAAGTGVAPNTFVNWLESEIARTSTAVVEADHQLALLASGQATSLHQVMLSLEEARLSMQLLVQIRNRLLDAYQEVIRMQV